MDKRTAMIIRNRAAKAAREGKLDPARVNRAFGIVQSRDAEQHLSKYQATTRACNCPDFKRTGKPCKHVIARMMIVRAGQIGK